MQSKLSPISLLHKALEHAPQKIKKMKWSGALST